MRSPRQFDSSVWVAIGLIVVAAAALLHSASTTTLLFFVVAVPSIILHEISHGVVALACGDDTAKRAGRLTLNPIRHVDVMGTLILPGLLSLAGFGPFGYAKPVPVNPGRMRHPRNGHLVTSLAGPVTNLVLAGLSILVLRLDGSAHEVNTLVSFGQIGQVPLGDRLLYLLGLVNVVLAVFNALPIPPLDGSAVVERFLPGKFWPAWLLVRRYAMVALVVIVLIDPGQFLGRVFGPAERAWAHLLVK